MAKLKNNLKYLMVILVGFFNSTAFGQDNDSGGAAGSEEEAKASSKGQLSAGAIAAAVAAADIVAFVVVAWVVDAMLAEVSRRSSHASHQ